MSAAHSPLPADIAQQARQYILQQAAHAYADAVIHNAYTSAVIRGAASTSQQLEACQRHYRGSDQETLLDSAFDLLTRLVDIRSAENPRPGQVDYQVKDLLPQVEDLQQRIAQAVTRGDMPADCLRYFQNAREAAVCAQPRTQWVAAALARRESLGHHRI